MSAYDIWKTANPPEYDEFVGDLRAGKTQFFPDDSTIFTDDETGNRTVIGKMAHEYYFEMMRKEHENV